MRASVLFEQGKPLSVEDLELERPRTGEVRVRMAASGETALSPQLAASMLDEVRKLDQPANEEDRVITKREEEVLQLIDPIDRLRRVHQLMTKETEVLEIQNDINTQARGEMDKTQREFYLRQQMKAIQQELGS